MTIRKVPRPKVKERTENYIEFECGDDTYSFLCFQEETQENLEQLVRCLVERIQHTLQDLKLTTSPVWITITPSRPSAQED